MQPSIANSATEAMFERRANYSRVKIKTLSSSLSKSADVKRFDELSIFAAGSYGRLEASQHSDVDLFFILPNRRESYNEINVTKIQMFAEVIRIGYDQYFPKFSNDGQYLDLLFLPEIMENMGSRDDDFKNHFTARMLLLLEGRPLLNEEQYNSILSQIIESYFRDYTHHPNNFKPTFLVNDIIRFWKTLCLNYEHGRNQEDNRLIIKQKIKNFKLKYSRLLTCFATIGQLATFGNTISPGQVVAMCALTPAQRYRSLAEYMPTLRPILAESMESYAWFMDLTSKSKEELEEYFSDKQKRTDAFANAQRFGDTVYEVLRAIDSKNPVLRYLVV